MALRDIIKYPSAILRKKARTVDKIDTSILTILEDMSETLQNAGGIGLAAPQIGVSLRLIVIKNEMTYMMLINPVLLKEEGEQISLEGCLSLPGIYAKIKRPEAAIARALDQNGKQIDIKVSSRLAATLAHEIDHLNGILLLDKAIRVVTYRR